MSHLLRCGLVAVGLVVAFAAGFYLKPVPTVPTVAAQPPVRPVTPPPIIDPDVKPATALGQPQPARPEFDPLDAAGMAMIRRELGHKTTVLDKSEPLPAVLADAQKTPPAPHKQYGGGAYIVIAPPTPMDGPMPRVDPPPMPAMPTIPDLVPPPPATPAAVKLVNTRAIAIDFEVTKTGSSPVTATELWTTRDGGSTWAKTDRMAGCQSPFRTSLGSEGVYGFRLVFESESGMRSAEPKHGDQPDLSVVLDTTPPAITLFSPERVPGAEGKVRFLWTMSDAHLDGWYARLEYSVDGQTWHLVSDRPVAGPQGHYQFDWAPPPSLAPRVMFRVTGRDGAGNSATVATAAPVTIDLVSPAGKVTGVRSGEMEVGPMPREVPASVRRSGFPFRPAAGRAAAQVTILATKRPGVRPDDKDLERTLNVEIIRSFDAEFKVREEPVSIVPMSRIEEYKSGNPNWRSVHPCDLSKELARDMDYEVDVELVEFDLNRLGTSDHGHALVSVAIYDLAAPLKEPVVKAEIEMREPSGGEQPEVNRAGFRQQFIRCIGARIAHVVLTQLRPAGEPESGPMPREINQELRTRRTIPEPLRSVLPILLGSPSFLVPIACAHPSSETTGLKWSVDTARQFVETPVVEVEQVERFVRRELFTEPAVGPELTPVLVVDPQDRSDDYGIAFIASRLPESLEEHAQRLEAERARLEAERNRAAFERPIGRFLDRQLTSEQLRPYQQTAGYSSGRSLIHHLIDPDWKPTTATPESCRWEYEPAPTNLWGTPPGVRLDF